MKILKITFGTNTLKHSKEIYIEHISYLIDWCTKCGNIFKVFFRIRRLLFGENGLKFLYFQMNHTLHNGPSRDDKKYADSKFYRKNPFYVPAFNLKFV